MPIKRGSPRLPVTEDDIRADRLRNDKLDQAQSDANKRGSVFMRMTVLPDGRIRSLSPHISLEGGPRLTPAALEAERVEGWLVEILEITPDPRPSKAAAQAASPVRQR